MKTFEISYTYSYRQEINKVFKAVDGLDALDAIESWATENTSSINNAKLQEIHLGHFSKEGRVSHSYGNILFKWERQKDKTPIQKAIDDAKQKWVDDKNEKII